MTRKAGGVALLVLLPRMAGGEAATDAALQDGESGRLHEAVHPLARALRALQTDTVEGERSSSDASASVSEYSKAVELSSLGVPVITAVFPGPAVHAKTARGEMVRFCACFTLVVQPWNLT